MYNNKLNPHTFIASPRDSKLGWKPSASSYYCATLGPLGRDRRTTWAIRSHYAAQDRETSYLVQIANLDKRRNERFFSLSEDLTRGVLWRCQHNFRKISDLMVNEAKCRTNVSLLGWRMSWKNVYDLSKLDRLIIVYHCQERLSNFEP